MRFAEAPLADILLAPAMLGATGIPPERKIVDLQRRLE